MPPTYDAIGSHHHHQQQQQQQQMSAPCSNLADMPESRTRMIASILSICEKMTISLDREGVANAVKAIVILCTKYVDKEQLFKTVLPDMFLDWEYVRNQQQHQQNSSTISLSGAGGGGGGGGAFLGAAMFHAARRNFFGDASVWMSLLQFVRFEKPNLPEALIQKQYPPLYCLHAAVQSASGAQGKLDFGDACHMLILSNIEGLASKMMIQLHTSARLNKNTQVICEDIMARLADERHSAEVYSSTFEYVLGKSMVVDEAGLAQHIAYYKQTKMERDRAWVMKAVQNKICRPSLRKVAEIMMKGGGGGGGGLGDSGASGGGMRLPHASSSDAHSHHGRSVSVDDLGTATMGGDGAGVSSMTFEHHCMLVRYPNSMSNLRRIRCYLLACQAHHFDYRAHLAELVDKDVARALADNPVDIPDVNSLYMGIDSIAMNIRPFEQLNQFRTKCFLSFASHQKRGLSLTQVLKLYVCAYQVRPVWKTLWTSVYPVISPQIIRDVETFASSTPFAVREFIQILKTSSPF